MSTESVENTGKLKNPVKQKIQAGQPVLMAFVTMPSVQLVQILARSGLDALIIDMEHGQIGIESAQAMIAATSGTRAVPIVRVPWNVPWLVKPILDAGALGIVFPMIGSPAEAEAAVKAVKYPPEGERGFGPFNAPFRWGVPLPDYVKTANDEILTIVLIEHPGAVKNINEIVNTPGIDVAILAPGDLATNLGHYGQFNHPEVQAYIAEAEPAILRSNVALGGGAFSPEQANNMIERGNRVLVIAIDSLLIQEAVASRLQGIKR